MRKNLALLIALLFVGLSLNAQDKPQKWSEPTPMWAFNLSNTNHAPFQQVPEQQVYQKTTPTYYYSPDGVTAVNPSFRVLPRTNSTQSEVILVRHPSNPLIMFGSSNAANFVSGVWISEGVYMTTNGGVSWYGSDTLNGAPATNHGGDPGPTIDKDGRIFMTHLGYSTSGMFANYSTDNGLTWSANYTIQAGGVDKNFAGTDDAPSSPYYGRSYCVWTQWSGTYNAQISYTTNGGVAWSTPTVILPSTGGRINRAEDIRVSSTGQVNVCWTPTNGSSPEDYCAYAKSTDGGVTFTGSQTTFPMSGLLVFNTGFTPYGIRMNSFPRIDVDRSGGPRNNWIYILVSQKNLAPAGSDPDIVLHRSTDNGATWSAGIRVNQDPINNGKYQFFNAIRVDEYGGVNCIYYDNRNTSADSAEVYISRSMDGGNTWTEYNISGHRFKPKPVSASLATGYAGDYIGITSGNNKIWGFWMDDASGIYQAWTASIDLGPSISHTPLTNTEQITGSRVVNCVITPAGSGINPSLTKLYYAKNSTTWTNVALTNSSGTNWTASIPLSGAGVYNYYLTTTDSMSRAATAPAGAPAYYYSFIASSDTVKPVIVHSPLPNCPKTQWPSTVSATVTDNIGVDSVWVKWYKNNTSTGIKQFKLLASGGNVYSNPFNSTQAEVAYNDSIFYRVFARDNSSGHNADSTALYKFKIINLVNVCVGTGTSSSNYPYTTYWMDGRTQMLYTAAELLAGGASANSVITRLGFNIISVGGPAMSGFNVRFQHTTATSVTGFVSTGWTTAFTGTYTVGATGWQYVDMTAPYFTFNGTSNLLVEICYDNSAYTAYSPVNATSIANMTWGYYTDNVTGCTMTGGATQSIRPNACFTMTSLINANGTSNIVPSKYALNQNYPNPFNPVTKISYEIPKQGFVNLKIYDVLGREVKSLVNEVKSPGVYAIDFNGAELSSGVYFYRLESNGFTDIKKMMLIK